MDRRPKATFVYKSLRVQGKFFSGDILAFIFYYYLHFLPLRQALEATKASYLFFSFDLVAILTSKLCVWVDAVMQQKLAPNRVYTRLIIYIKQEVVYKSIYLPSTTVSSFRNTVRSYSIRKCRPGTGMFKLLSTVEQWDFAL